MPILLQMSNYLPPREAAHDSGLAEEPQEAQETNDGEGGSRVQQDLEEKDGTLFGALLCGGKRHLLAYLKSGQVAKKVWQRGNLRRSQTGQSSRW